MKYVVRCHKGVLCSKVGLGSKGRYLKGDFVTYEGTPTKKLEEACIYSNNELFPFEDWYSWGSLNDYFEAVPVEVKTIISIKES